jgi:hypothetical protein
MVRRSKRAVRRCYQTTVGSAPAEATRVKGGTRSALGRVSCALVLTNASALGLLLFYLFENGGLGCMIRR